MPLVLGTVLLLLLAVGWGRLLARLFGVEKDGLRAGTELQALVGMALVGHALALPAMLAGVSILIPAALLPFGVLGLLRPTDEPEQEGWAWPTVIAAAAGFAALWSLDSTGRFAEFAAGGPMRLWFDVFIHAGTIAEFGDPRAAAARSVALAGVPNVLYHAVPHVFPALAVRMLGIGPLEIIPALWLPLGIFLTTLGILALGRSLSGLAGGALTLGLFVLLPDSAAYGLRNGFLSFHWVMEKSSGGLYGLPVGLAALALLVSWSRTGGWGQLALGIVALASVFLLQVHVLIWLLAPVAVLILLRLPRPGPRGKAAVVGLGFVAAPLILALLARDEIARDGWRPYLTGYVFLLHTLLGPTAYDGLYAWLLAHVGRLGALPAGLLLALLGMGGLPLLTWAAGLVAAARQRRLEALDCVPPVLIGWALILMAFAPTPFHGDVTDIRQRGFVVLVAVLLAWTARYVLLFRPVLARPVPLAATAAALLAVTSFWINDAKHPRMAWGQPYVSVQPRPGLVEAARWIGREAQGGESFASADQDATADIVDDATIILGVSGVPAYLSRPALMRASGPPRDAVAAARLSRLARVAEMTDADDARRLLLHDGIGFYVASRSAFPAWDRDAAMASFIAGDVAVWRVRP